MSRPRPRRLRLFALLLLASLLLGACGESHTKVTTGTYAGESGANAPYLDVGPLVYEVQLSRELNPADEEDASYLVGLSSAQRTLRPGEEWFAAFAPATAPRVAVAVLLVKDGAGGTTAAPVAREVLEAALRAEAR